MDIDTASRQIARGNLTAAEELVLLAVLEGRTGEPVFDEDDDDEAGFDNEDDEAYWAAADYDRS